MILDSAYLILAMREGGESAEKAIASLPELSSDELFKIIDMEVPTLSALAMCQLIRRR